MRRPRPIMRARVTVPLLTCLAFLLPAAPAMGQPTVVPAAHASVVRAAVTAASVNAEAVALRRDVSRMLQQYTDQYGDRFTRDELAQLSALRADADRTLVSVVVATSRITSATRTGSRAAIRSSADQALRTWSRAKATAETSMDKARAIMEPHLSLFEKLQALNDYNAMMDRFDVLGEHIRALR